MSYKNIKIQKLFKALGYISVLLRANLIFKDFSIQPSIYKYGKCSKISNTSWLPKRHRQTVQTQISLIQGLPYLLFRQAFCEFQPW